jgi:hypothetical protein
MAHDDPTMIWGPRRWSVGSLVAVTAIVVAASATACTSATPATTAGRSATPPQQSPVSVTPGTGGATRSVMQVNVRSGKDQGSHYAFSAGPTCSYGLAADGADRADSWGNDYSGGNDDLSAMSIVIPKGAEAKVGDGSSVFLFDATVHGTHYGIDARRDPAAGGGLAKVLDYGKTGIITIDGRTADGTRVDSTIQCNTIKGR